jgi:hypothetical protein
MTMNEIERALRELRLSGSAATLSTRVMQAQSTQAPFLETFSSMLQDEFDRRRSRLTDKRFKQSRLDERPTLADFDWRFNPKLPRQACFELHTFKFIAEGGNALIIGKPGTGKTHLATALGVAGITRHGRRVRFHSTVDLVNALEREKAQGPAGRIADMDLSSSTNWATCRSAKSAARCCSTCSAACTLVRAHERADHHEPGLCRMERGVQRREDDDRAVGPDHPPLPHRRDRQ